MCATIVKYKLGASDSILHSTVAFRVSTSNLDICIVRLRSLCLLLILLPSATTFDPYTMIMQLL